MEIPNVTIDSGVPRRLDLPYWIVQRYIYDWFTKGFSIQDIASGAGLRTQYVERSLHEYEQRYKYGKYAVSAVN